MSRTGLKKRDTARKLFKVYWKEPIYFSISLVVSALLYGLLFYVCSQSIDIHDPVVMVLMFYGALICTVLVFLRIYLVGHLKGNAIEITKDQLPEVYEIIQKQSRILGLNCVPTMYLLERGGVLNAFATKLLRDNYVVLYSSLLEMAWTEGAEAVEFVIAHELGHIKRRHLQKYQWLFPSKCVPFLSSAYSRACEYTCDNVGFALSPEGARKGLLILAAGRSLYKKIDLDVYLRNARNASGFVSWFAEITSSHPHLSNRLANIDLLGNNHATAEKKA